MTDEQTIAALARTIACFKAKQDDDRARIADLEGIALRVTSAETRDEKAEHSAREYASHASYYGRLSNEHSERADAAEKRASDAEYQVSKLEKNRFVTCPRCGNPETHILHRPWYANENLGEPVCGACISQKLTEALCRVRELEEELDR